MNEKKSNMSNVKVCLNMIIKETNYNLVINCIKDVNKNIDAVVISDTGSPSKTLVELEKYLKSLDKPYLITQDDWKDFGFNRTRALRHAENFIFPDMMSVTDWKTRDTWFVMFMDADNITESIPVWDKRKLLKDDCYHITMRMGECYYDYVYLVKIEPNKTWVWNEPLHEYVAPLGWNPKFGRLTEGYIHSRRLGDRSANPLKYLCDALVFERRLLKFPTDSRCWFYTGQSYKDAGKRQEAINAYCKLETLKTAGSQDKWFALYQSGELTKSIEKEKGPACNDHLYLDYYWKSLNYSQRLESIFGIIEYFYNKTMFGAVVQLGRPFLNVQKPDSSNLYLDGDIWGWRFFILLSIAAYNMGDIKLGMDAGRKVIACPIAPKPVKDGAIENIRRHGGIV